MDTNQVPTMVHEALASAHLDGWTFKWSRSWPRPLSPPPGTSSTGPASERRSNMNTPITLDWNVAIRQHGTTWWYAGRRASSDLEPAHDYATRVRDSAACLPWVDAQLLARRLRDRGFSTVAVRRVTKEALRGEEK